MHFHPSRAWPGRPLDAAGPAPAPQPIGLLRVRGRVVVSGDVVEGASLGWGAELEVGGDFEGLAHLSPRSVLRVRGTYDGSRVGTDGLVVVAGRCALDLARTPGTAVQVGAVLTDGAAAWRVEPDGSLCGTVAARPCFDTWTDRPIYRWSARAGAFVPTT